MKKRDRLKENVKIRLQGIALLLIAYAAIKTEADGAGAFMMFMGFMMILPLKEIVKCVYHIAKAIVCQYEDWADRQLDKKYPL